MQALGFCFSMVPAIRRLYPENNEARKQAIRRHLEFFNTQPFVAAPILGVTTALEEQRANGAEIDDGAINGIKVGLMGPLAGVGDPIFWGTVRPVFAALGAGIAMSGSLLGPLLFFILFNLVRLATRYYGVAYGYSKGIDIVKDMGGGFLQKLTEGRLSSACLSWGHWLTSGHMSTSRWLSLALLTRRAKNTLLLSRLFWTS